MKSAPLCYEIVVLLVIYILYLYKNTKNSSFNFWHLLSKERLLNPNLIG